MGQTYFQNDFFRRPHIFLKSVFSAVVFLRTIMLASLILIFCPQIVSASALQSIDYQMLSGQKAQITLTFSEPVANPNSFSIDNPARIVLDFAEVTNALEKKTQAINLGPILTISTGEAGSRTRAVISLVKTAPYNIDQQGASIIVTIDNTSAIEQVGQQSKITEIQDIDFRRGQQGQGRLILALTDSNIDVDIRQQGQDIELLLNQVTLPEKLRYQLDVIDFATPVQTIETELQSNATRVIVRNQGGFEYLSYQSENTFTLEIIPTDQGRAITTQTEQNQYTGERLSLNFQDIEVRAVLQLLADFTGFNLVTSDTVQGSVTLRLKNVPWDQAMAIILKTKGLAMRQTGNVILVAPAAEIAAREKQQLEAEKQRIELEPLGSEMIEVNFAKAEEIVAILSGEEEESINFLSSRGSVISDSRTNNLYVHDTAENRKQIREMVKSLDVPVRQVLIEARIVTASDDFSKELGARFGLLKYNSSPDSLTATSGSLNATTQFVRQEDLEFNDRMNVNLPVTNPAGQIGLLVSSGPLGVGLELELSAMQAEGKGEIISNPRVITSNKKTALIEQGTEIPFQEASSSGATSVSFKEAVLKLEVTPQITPNGQIVMDLAVSKDSVGQVFSGIPSIDTQNVETQVLVNNGETIVLGGIYEQTSINSVRKVPFFGDLPILGSLFRTKFNRNDKAELLIFITPKIIEQDNGISR